MGNKKHDVGADFQKAMSAPSKEQNLLLTLSQRRHQNARQQIKTVILESYELFGESFTEEVLSDCKSIFEEFKNLNK